MVHFADWYIEILLTSLSSCLFFFQNFPYLLFSFPMRIEFYFLLRLSTFLVVSIKRDRFVTLIYLLLGLFSSIFNILISSLRDILRAGMIWFNSFINYLLKLLSWVSWQIHPRCLRLLVLKFDSFKLLLFALVHQSFDMFGHSIPNLKSHLLKVLLGQPDVSFRTLLVFVFFFVYLLKHLVVLVYESH